MGVTGWAEPSHVVIGDARTNKGANVADPRVPDARRPACSTSTSRTPTHLVIRAADGTWHRPMTDLELFCLQGFDGVDVVLEGLAQGPAPAHRQLRPGPCRRGHRASSAGSPWRRRGRGRLLLSGQPVWVDKAEAGAES
jgi:hypothetical protein